MYSHLHWSVPVAGYGITYAVVCAVPSVGITYVIDCYRPVASETLTALISLKNTIGFGLGFAVFPWIAKNSLLEVRISKHLTPWVIFCYFSWECLRAYQFSNPIHIYRSLVGKLLLSVRYS